MLNAVHEDNLLALEKLMDDAAVASAGEPPSLEFPEERFAQSVSPMREEPSLVGTVSRGALLRMP